MPQRVYSAPLRATLAGSWRDGELTQESGMTRQVNEALAQLMDARRREVEARRRLVPGFRLHEGLGRLRPGGRLERALRRAAGAPVRLVCAAGSAEEVSRLERNGAAAAALATGPGAADAFAIIDAARAVSTLPLLLSDLVVDDYQLLEAVAHGLDGVTLSATASDDVELQVRIGRARLLGLDPLVRVCDAEEMRRAWRAGATLLGLASQPLPRADAGVEAALARAGDVPPLATAVALAGAGLTADELRRLAATRCDALLAPWSPDLAEGAHG
jgi:indole-3-glycerol phosphate synthase